ncbi:uncharacterized protein LOC129256785 isoform X1 [Lytechinus pictus]|uniref:uncharacterized protein LOC129256785 isoform X1 n=2 Tax=Lytechinus pictus TaxID=7653 RepID=UPI0030B9C7E2
MHYSFYNLYISFSHLFLQISNHPDNRLEENGCLGEGYIPTHQHREHHVPLPPIRWDSHTLTLDFSRTPRFTNGALCRRSEDTYISLSSCERRRRRSNRRRRSPGDGRSGDSDQSGRRRNRIRGNSHTLPLPGRTAMGMQAPLRTSACLDDRRGMIEERVVTGASCEAILPDTVENMWARIENTRSTNVQSVGNHTNGIVNRNEETIMDRHYPEENTVLVNNNEQTEDSHKTSSSSTSPLQNHSPPSERSPSGSSERLTGGTASSSSRNTRTSSSNQRRQRRRRSSDRRMRTSSSNYSTSSTDHSSKSNGGIRQTARARQQQLFSTSSSSDSEDNTPQRPRRLIARMGNGGITHEVDKQGQSGQSNGPSRSRRHTRGTRNRQRPLSAQPTVGRQSIPQSQIITNAKPNPRPGTGHERHNTTHGLSPSSIQFNQHGRVKQKRPDSLDLKLIWSSHRGYIGHQSSLSTSSSADSYDPWIPRDGVTIAPNNEKLTVNMASSESKVPHKAPSCSKKKQLHRMSEGKNYPRNNLPASLQKPDNNAHIRVNPTCNDNGPMAEMGLPCSNIEREHATPEKDIDTTECCDVTENTMKDRPKSMVEFNKDTSILVSEILSHADGDISPAVKTVLQDIHSVIENDDRYLSELWQSACILDKFANKCTHQRNSLQNGIVRFKDNREQDRMEATVSKSEQMKFRHSCPDADDMQRQAEKMLNVSRAELVKSLEDARETIL